ncbi:hypothetical protein AALP_AA4G168700, partial [Arabis alpina]
MIVAGVHRLTFSLLPISLRTSNASFGISSLSIHQSLQSHHFSVAHHHSHRLVTFFSHNASGKSGDAEADTSFDEGEMLDKNEKSRKNPFASEELLKKLKKYGVSGILSYGILNTVYYTISFLLVWFYVAPAPGKMGYLAAAE